MATKKKTSSMKNSGVKNPAIITDGCNPELVKGADFDGIFEIPIIKAPEIIAIPKAIVPFSKMDKVDPSGFAICEYENDIEFANLLRNPDSYVKQFKKYAVLSTLKDGVNILFRPYPRTEASPAVDIMLSIGKLLKKIHFIQR